MSSFDVNDPADEEPDERSKGERTKDLIREAALASFRERGYDETTVRAIAQQTGVSLGVVNYHFPSKNHLVQELYLDATREFRDQALERMSGVTDLVQRLRIAYTFGIRVLQPFHEFAPGFVAAAVSPRSPINPLSDDSDPAFDAASSVFETAVSGAKHRLPDDITGPLPEALTVSYLLLALYFTYDRSPEQRRTFRLLDLSLKMLGRALPLMRIGPARKPISELLRLVGEIRA